MQGLELGHEGMTSKELGNNLQEFSTLEASKTTNNKLPDNLTLPQGPITRLRAKRFKRLFKG